MGRDRRGLGGEKEATTVGTGGARIFLLSGEEPAEDRPGFDGRLKRRRRDAAARVPFLLLQKKFAVPERPVPDRAQSERKAPA